MQKPFNRREERFVHCEADHDDNQHDPDHLIHRTQLSSVMEQVPETESRQNRHVDFRRHQ